MTAADFIQDLNALGEELSDPQSILTEIGEQITSEMKRLAPVDTGALRNSISYTITGNQILINMLDYGAFQNYGVGGSSSSPINLTPVPAFGIIQPSSPPYYRFRTREFGLRAQQFFNMDTITNQVADAFADAVNEEL